MHVLRIRSFVWGSWPFDENFNFDSLLVSSFVSTASLLMLSISSNPSHLPILQILRDKHIWKPIPRFHHWLLFLFGDLPFFVGLHKLGLFFAFKFKHFSPPCLSTASTTSDNPIAPWDSKIVSSAWFYVHGHSARSSLLIPLFLQHLSWYLLYIY